MNKLIRIPKTLRKQFTRSPAVPPYGIILLLVVVSLCLGSDSAFAMGVEGEYTGEADYDPTLVRCAVASMFQFIEGAFGALVMVVAGLGAIISAAMGAYRASVGMIVVAVGSFILRSLVSLFFGAGYDVCSFT